jgi:hypothetical protein
MFPANRRHFVARSSIILPRIIIVGALCQLALLTPLCAQTAAQKALEKEPEMVSVQRALDDYQARQNLPSNDIRKPTTFDNLFDSYIGIKGTAIALERIRQRLETKVYDCIEKQSSCPWMPAQEELSELLRQEERQQEMVHAIGTAYGGSDFLNAMMGPGSDNRWAKREIALGEAEGVAGNEGGGAQKMTEAHESAWAACFQKHDWVKDAAERRPYETCLDTTDPLVEYCNQQRRTRASIAHCPTEITMVDVGELRYYHDRWDPAKNSAQVMLVRNSPVHLILLEPLLAPDMPPPQPGRPDMGGKVMIRAKLENSIPGQSRSVPGTVEVVPAGTEVTIEADFGPAGGHRVNASLTLWTRKALLNDNGADQLASQPITRQVPWPQAGTVIIPANTPFTFVTNCGCPYFRMSEAQFAANRVSSVPAPAANASSGHPGGVGKGGVANGVVSGAAPQAAPAPASAEQQEGSSHPIVVGSQMQPSLLEPVTVSGIRAGKRFHAQLKVDMRLPRGASEIGALQLPKGTDLYMKVTDKNSGSAYGGHTAELTIDYVVINNQQVPVTAPAITHTFTDQYLSPARSPRANTDSVVWPAGDLQWFTVTEQAEVTSGTLQAGSAYTQLQTNAVVASAVDAAALRIYAGTRLPLVLVDKIDLASAQPGKLMEARLAQTTNATGGILHPDALVLPEGTEVYLKAEQKSYGSSNHIPVAITVDHVVFSGASIAVETAPHTKMFTTGQSAGSTMRGLEGQLSSRFGHAVPSAAPTGNSDALGPQSKLELTVTRDVSVPGARTAVPAGSTTR